MRLAETQNSKAIFSIILYNCRQGKKAMCRNLLIITACFITLYGMGCLGIPCLFLKITGCPCPGCGMTHAIKAALKLDFYTAYQYHAMFWSMPLIALLLSIPFSKQAIFLYYILWIIIGIGFLLNWLYHLSICIN